MFRVNNRTTSELFEEIVNVSKPFKVNNRTTSELFEEIVNVSKP